jgi:hypothetical protein
VLVLVIVVATRPAHFSITRTTTIAAPDSVIFAQVNDFHRWDGWSPWARLDPAMKTTYSGAPAGAGAVYEWAGDGKVGEGRMTILESKPSSLVRINLEFLKPFAATNLTDFTFTPDGSGTKVTWTMSGENNFMTKAVGLMMNMDKTVGGDFEKGLSQLKTVAESQAQASPIPAAPAP